MGRRAENKEKNQNYSLKEYIKQLEVEKDVLLGKAEKFGLWGQVLKSHENSIKAQLISNIIKELKEILDENN